MPRRKTKKAQTKKISKRQPSASKKGGDDSKSKKSNPYTADLSSSAITKSNNAITEKLVKKLKAEGYKGPAKPAFDPKKAAAAKKTSTKKASNASKKSTSGKKSDAGTGEVTKKFKGGAPVDEHFTISGYMVYSEGNTIYAKTLNLSNVGGNNNKFYILQILVDEATKSNYYCFFRWGRVGTPGKSSSKKFGTAAKAIATFNKKLNDKKYKSGYTEIDIVYEDEPTPEEQEERMKNALKDSKLPPSVNKLVNLIFDTKLISKCMTEIGYDPKKLPLGKLSVKAIEEAYGILNTLMSEVKGRKSQ